MGTQCLFPYGLTVYGHNPYRFRMYHSLTPENPGEHCDVHSHWRTLKDSAMGVQPLTISHPCLSTFTVAAS